VVRFVVQVGSAEFAAEPVPPDRSLGVRTYRRVRGGIEIRSGDLPVVLPEDELVPLVTNLCFRAIPIVLSARHAVVALTDTYGYVRLDLEGDRIRLSGDGLPDTRVSAAGLLHGLIDCGARFRAWLRGLALEGDVTVIDDQLGVLEAAARDALDATKLV
jgi:hypothetical protein